MPAPRVLIADDQPEVLRAISFICSAEGYQVTTVNSPAAVLAKLGKEDFDLVLIDLNYRQDIESGKEGLELLKQIRGVDSSMPVVVMTAFASIQLAVEAVRLGAKDFLQKPWENERLLSILRTQIAIRDATGAGDHRASCTIRCECSDYRGEWHRKRGGGSNASPTLSALCPTINHGEHGRASRGCFRK